MIIFSIYINLYITNFTLPNRYFRFKMTLVTVYFLCPQHSGRIIFNKVNNYFIESDASYTYFSHVIFVHEICKNLNYSTLSNDISASSGEKYSEERASTILKNLAVTRWSIEATFQIYYAA